MDNLKVSRGLLHSCEVCSSSFARRGDLTRHSYIHEDIKPYKCKVCSKGFSQSSGLNTHMNTHSGNKPYWCSFGCMSRFGDPSSCARHEKEIHRRMVPYRCPDPYCSSRIKRRSSFVDHLKVKHGIDVDVVDIDSFAPPLLPAKHRKPRGKSTKPITETPLTDECNKQAFDPNGGLSSACSESPSPVDALTRSSNSLDNFQVPLYPDVFDDFFETKRFCPLDSPVDFPTPEQYHLHPICVPFLLSTSVKPVLHQTPSVGLPLSAVQHADSEAARDVAFNLNPFSVWSPRFSG